MRWKRIEYGYVSSDHSRLSKRWISIRLINAPPVRRAQNVHARNRFCAMTSGRVLRIELAITSDRSSSAIRGDLRPLNGQAHRAAPVTPDLFPFILAVLINRPLRCGNHEIVGVDCSIAGTLTASVVAQIDSICAAGIADLAQTMKVAYQTTRLPSTTDASRLTAATHRQRSPTYNRRRTIRDRQR